MHSTVRKRRWSFRLLAILLGVAPFLLAEVGLRLLLPAASEPPQLDDPYVHFSATRPLFELTADGSRYAIPESRAPFFKPDSFSAEKDPREFRIFCFGGSTVQGNPYSIETSFTTWLELSLQAADPSRQWEVINCGGISYASYRLAPIWRECLQYEPDLFVLYVGDNEFLEDRSYTTWKDRSTAVKWLDRLGSHSRLVQAGRAAWQRIAKSTDEVAGGRTALPAEVEALLDYQGGLAQYHRDDAWREGVREHFDHTVQAMVRAARGASVPVFIVDPVSNIKDCPPFKVELSAELTPVERERFATLLAAAQQPDLESAECRELLEEALAIDGRHAGVLYWLGREYLAAGRRDEAWRMLLRAKDEDVCPLRTTEPLREILYRIAREARVPLVPVWEDFQRRSPEGIPGDELLLDHVHPTITGQQHIADLLLAEITQQAWLTPAEDWEHRRRELYRDHLETLDAPYYARGKEHLEGLRRWATGRVKKLKGSGGTKAAGD